MSENEDQDKSKDQTSNIFDDSFFDTLNDIDDGLGDPNFKKLGNENINDIQDIEDLNIKKETRSDIKLNAKSLPVTKISQSKVKETDEMTKTKFDPLDLPSDDPASDQFKEIWTDMNRPDISDFKLMAIRTEPSTIKGVKISGYLETFHLPTSIPEIIEKLGQKYGGGRYSIRIVNGAGKYVKQKTFEISGLPKIPDPVETPTPQPIVPPATPLKTENKKDEDDSDTEWDELDEDYDPTPRRRLKPFPTGNIYEDPYFRRETQQPIYGRQSLFKDDSENKEVKEKVSNLESKLDRISDAIQNTKNSGKSLFDPDMVKAIAPVLVTWLDSKGNKETAGVTQFSDMNKQIVGLMQGMQDLVRLSDKAKEDLSEKERKEREQNRREMFEYQNQMEQRFLDQQRKSEERNQQMLLQLRESLENKHTQSLESVDKNRLEHEKLRQEFKEREEKLREEARLRDENARNKEIEARERARQDETRWREELRQRDEETRRRELEWRDELRQKEIAAINETKLRELDIMKQMRDMDNQKTGMQQKLIEQIYSNNNNNRESQLQMELAIAKMTNDNESRMLQSNAEMQLEKIRHATQMQMAKMKNDLTAIENKKSEDPLDSAMQDYLKRKLQIDMIKELNMEVDEGDLPNNSLTSMLKKLAEFGGPMLMKILMGGDQKQMMPGPGRVVNPNTQNVPVNEKVASEEDIIFEDDVEDVEEDIISEEEESQEETQPVVPDLNNIDPMQEIPRVSEYFQYLKVAIEGGTISPEEAANEARLKLSPQIVDFLSTITDSKIVIDQLYPLLNSMGGSFANFFVQPNSLEWLNKMLLIMNNSNKEEKVEPAKPEVENKVEPSEVNSQESIKNEKPIKEKKKKQKANT